MYSYDFQKIKSLFDQLIKNNVPAGVYDWLHNATSNPQSTSQFNGTFGLIQRKTGKQIINISGEEAKLVSDLTGGMMIHKWSVDRLARAWLLLQLDTSDKGQYFKTIENLFLTAEVNELVALYSSLPLLAYPGMWAARCAEGIRNNIADVLQAVMCNNPYPSHHLNEPAWNQLVLKAFFTEKPVMEIVGLDARANQALAFTLSDYAHERWAAHRPVNPLLWRCVAPFVDDKILDDIKKILASTNEIERKAGALALYNSRHPNATGLIPPEYISDLNSGKLSWQSLSDKINDYVLQQ